MGSPCLPWGGRTKGGLRPRACHSVGAGAMFVLTSEQQSHSGYAAANPSMKAESQGEMLLLPPSPASVFSSELLINLTH